jgi:hypothetical protein
MPTLVACLSVGKGTWAPVQKLMATKQFDKVILIANQWAKDNYNNTENADIIVIDAEKPLFDNILFLESQFKERINELEVGLNMISGTGNEHMAVLAALLRIGVGVRLVTGGESGLVELQ